MIYVDVKEPSCLRSFVWKVVFVQETVKQNLKKQRASLLAIQQQLRYIFVLAVGQITNQTFSFLCLLDFHFARLMETGSYVASRSCRELLKQNNVIRDVLVIFYRHRVIWSQGGVLGVPLKEYNIYNHYRG